MREAFPYLKESRGSVINFASGAGLFGKLGQSSYAAAKEGIRGLSRVAAAEWGPFGVNVNVVCPLAMTPGLEKWKEMCIRDRGMWVRISTSRLAFINGMAAQPNTCLLYTSFV